MQKFMNAVGTCKTCGKQMFLSRKAARRVWRTRHPGEQMSIYTCGEYFHLGHIPAPIKRGNVDRRYWENHGK